MATITPIKPTIAGVAFVAHVATSGGDMITNPRGTAIAFVTNGSASPMVVTVTAQRTTRPADPIFPAQTLADQDITIAAGATKAIGPIGPAFVDDDGLSELTYSDETSVTVDVIDPSTLP
jgi:hypothetical protein